MSSAAQIAANQKNAQFSTGPKSEEGKSRSSLNGVKTGLTGATVLLASDDVAAYERLVAGSFAAWKPATDREKVLVQSIADTEWRLLRIPSLESGTYALGRLQFASKLEDQPEALRSTLLDAYIFQTSRRDLTNLSIQESRLRRQREKDDAELNSCSRNASRSTRSGSMLPRTCTSALKKTATRSILTSLASNFHFRKSKSASGSLRVAAFAVNIPNSSPKYMQPTSATSAKRRSASGPARSADG